MAFKRSGVRLPLAPPLKRFQSSSKLEAAVCGFRFCWYWLGAKKMGRCLGGPSLGRKRPRRGVPSKYREAIVEMRGALLSRGQLFSLNYVHESSPYSFAIGLANVRNQTFTVALFWSLRRHPSAGPEVCTTSSMKRSARSMPPCPSTGPSGCGLHAPSTQRLHNTT